MSDESSEAGRAQPDQPRQPRPGAALFVVVLSSFLVPFMMAALNVALPAIGSEFALSAVSLGWVVTSYSLATAVVLMPFGRIGDLHGRKRVFVWGLVVFTLGAVLSAVAGTGAAFLAGRVVNGIGAGMNFATGMAILMTVVPPRQRGQALGWNVAAVYLGLSVGPALGGVIAHDFGWRWIFGVSALAAVAATVLSVWKLDGEWIESRGAAFDLGGSLLYAAALVALIAGCTMVPTPAGIGLVIASGLGFAGFVRWERRCASPMVDVSLFTANRVFAFSSLATLINYSATAGVGFLISLYLQYAKGLSPQQAGLVLMIQPIVMTVLSPIAGRLSDRVEPGRMASAGMALAAAALAVFCLLRLESGMGLAVTGLVILGVGFALFSSPNSHVVMGSVEAKHYGAASGVLGTMRVVGQVMSMAVVMLISTLVLGRAQIGPDNVSLFIHCQRTAFVVFAVLCLAGTFASLVRGDKRFFFFRRF